MAAEPANRSEAGWLRFAPLLTLFAVVIAYLPSVDYEILERDRPRVLGALEPGVAAGFDRFVTAEYDAGSLPRYRPLASATYDLQVGLHGPSSAALRAVNVALVAGLVAAVFSLLRWPAFGIDPLAALAGAAVVGFHPVTASCVYDVTGRDTLLAVGCAVLGLSCFLRGGRAWRPLATLFYAAGLASNEAVLLLPAVYVAADRLGATAAGPVPAARRLAQAAPELAVAAVYLGVRGMLFEAAEFPGLALFAEPLGPLLSLLFAAQSIFLPGIAAVVEPPAEVWLSVPRLLLVAAAGSLVVLAASRCWSAIRRATALFSVWFLALWIPNANVFEQTVPFTETVLLPALIATIAGLAALLSALAKNAAAFHVGSALSIAGVAVLGVIAMQRGPVYADDVTFTGTQALHVPHDAELQFEFGNALVEHGQTNAAIDVYRRASALDPEHLAALNNLAWLLATKPEARKYELREAVRHAETLRSLTGSNDPGVLDTLAVAYAAIGRFEDAVETISVAITLAQRVGPEALLPDLQRRLALYGREQAYRGD